MAASLLAGCSGGAGGVMTSGAPTTPTTPVMPSGVSFQLDMSKLQSVKRSPKFVGASVNDIHYVFTGGTNPVGDILLSACQSTANVGNGSTYTCNVAVPPFVGYTVALTLKSGSTAVGTGSSAAPFTITQGVSTPVAIAITPINAGPALSIANGQSLDFFVDGTPQSLAVNANELDPAGNIITTALGPVTNWPAGGLTWSDVGGTAGITLATTVLVPPSGPSGNTALISYDGASVNASSLSVSLNDGVNGASTIQIPYVFLSANPSPVTVPSAGNINLTVTETITTGTVPDTLFISISPNCAGKVDFAPALGVNNIAVGGSSGTFTYALSPHHPGSAGSCTLNVASQVDSNLVTHITVNYPA